jgi:DNA-binding CsgD family transcriptional regulator
MITNQTALEYNNSINKSFLDACRPLLEFLDLTHFIYIKLIGNNKRLYLCNDMTWIEDYLRLRLYEDPLHERRAIQHQGKSQPFAYWEGYGSDMVFDILRNKNMANGFIIYEGNEIFSFCTTCEKTNVFFSYLHNIEILKHFILFFKSKCASLIKAEDDGRLISSNTKANGKPAEANSAPQKDVHNIYNLMPLTSFILDLEESSVKLCKREAESLMYFSAGKNISETAWLMHISPRTTETYLNNLKIKLNCDSKSQLIELFQKSNLRNITPHCFHINH